MGFSLKKNVFTDEFGEILKETGRQVKSLPKDIAKSAKGQILGQSGPSASQPFPPAQQGGGLPSFPSGEQRPLPSASKEKSGLSKPKNKIDPVTGKPVPSKQMVTYLSNALQQRDLALLERKRREILLELEKQRMKAGDDEEVVMEGEGPQIKKDKKKPNPQAVQQMLKNAQSTGEAGKDAIGG